MRRFARLALGVLTAVSSPALAETRWWALVPVGGQWRDGGFPADNNLSTNCMAVLEGKGPAWAVEYARAEGQQASIVDLSGDEVVVFSGDPTDPVNVFIYYRTPQSCEETANAAREAAKDLESRRMHELDGYR